MSGPEIKGGSFVHVIRGRCRDEAALAGHWGRWQHDHGPGAEGFLGATAGVDDGGTFIAMVRFETEDAARRNGARPQQGRWWQELLDHFDGDVAVQDCHRTDVWNRGGRDDAGFVQIRQGHSPDPDRLRHLYVEEQPVRMGPHRPEVLGGLFAWHGAGDFTLSAYFTSESAARNGERLDEFKPFFADIDAVMQDVAYFDLRRPWLSSPSAGVASREEATDEALGAASPA